MLLAFGLLKLLNPSQTEERLRLIDEARADEVLLEFNLEPPENAFMWRIHRVTLPNHSSFQNEVMRYAYDISNDKDFLYTLKAECGTIDPYCLGDNGHAHGFCQIHDQYHPQIVSDPRFRDWKWQINTCWKLYKGGVRFYGYDVRHKVIKHFNFQ
jgi:hypothetical protein